MHYGRYGSDSEDPRLSPLFIGYPTLVRGYDVDSFTAADCRFDLSDGCPAFERLIGSRTLVGNVELRMPLLRPFGVRRGLYGPLPVELAFFADAGVAWDSASKPDFFGGDREPVGERGRGPPHQRVRIRRRSSSITPARSSVKSAGGSSSSISRLGSERQDIVRELPGIVFTSTISPCQRPLPTSAVPADLQELIDEFLAVEGDAERLVEPLDDEQFNWSPAPGAWSIGQCIDHLNVTNQKYLDALSAAVERAQAEGLTRTGPIASSWIGRRFIAIARTPRQDEDADASRRFGRPIAGTRRRSGRSSCGSTPGCAGVSRPGRRWT